MMASGAAHHRGASARGGAGQGDGRGMRASVTRTLVAVTSLVAVCAAAPAQAQETRTLTGPATGDQGVFLTYVACSGLFGQATAPVPRINLGPYAAPLGRRSLGLVPTGTGTASGPYVRFDSLTSLDTSVSVAATGGASGVSQLLAVRSEEHTSELQSH